MKHFIFFLFVLAPLLSINSQNKKNGFVGNTKTTTPQIVSKLKAGKKAKFGDKSIHFIKVLEDSRCPTGVNCAWEGQAKVLIAFYEKDVLLEEKELIIGSRGITPDKPKDLIKSEDNTIQGYNLSPYPSNGQKIDPSGYYLELLVR